MAKVFNSKFTYVSPVWYQIKCTPNALVASRAWPR